VDHGDFNTIFRKAEIVLILSRHVLVYEVAKSLQAGIILPGRVRRILAVACRDDVLGVFEAGGF
jgi:hypothetical protein